MKKQSDTVRRNAAKLLGTTPDDVALSQRELGDAREISRQAVSALIRRPGWPLSKTPPWSKAAFAEWHRRLIRIDNAATYRADRAAAEQPPAPDKQPAGSERFGRLMGELAERYALDPRFWLRAIVGLIEELDVGGPSIKIPAGAKGWTEDRKRAFVEGVTRRTHEHRAKLRKLALATNAAVDHLLKTETFAHESPGAMSGPDLRK